MSSDCENSLHLFRQLVQSSYGMEDSQSSTWRFKALVNIIQLIVDVRRYDELRDVAVELQSCIRDVSRYDISDGYSKILDIFSHDEFVPLELLIEFYQLTADQLLNVGSSLQRMWFTISLQLGKLYMRKPNQYCDQLDSLMINMKVACKSPDGDADDIDGKGSFLLDLYAFEITWLQADMRLKHSARRRRLKEVLDKSVRANFVVSNPRSMSIVREIAGNTFARDGNYEEAFKEFFEAFKLQASCGEAAASVRLLKFSLVTSLLSGSAINIFDSREARSFSEDLEVRLLIHLRRAFDEHNASHILHYIHQLEVCDTNSVHHSAFTPYLEKLAFSTRMNLLVAVCNCYESVSLSKLKSRLLLHDEEEVRRMLMQCIKNKSLNAHIDGISGIATIHAQESTLTHELSILHSLNEINRIVSKRLDNIGRQFESAI